MDPLVPRMTTRRDFARTAALAAAVPLIASLDACAHAASPAPASAGTPEPAAAPAPAPAPAAAPARAPDPAAEALTELLKARFPDRLTAEQWAEVRRGVEGNLASARTLHDFPLDTAVEPPFAFRPYRGGAR